MVEAGLRQYDVAARFGVTHAVITRLLTRYRLYGTANELRQSGRPRVTTARQDRHIRTSHLRNRFQTIVATAAVTLGRTNNRISAQTVRNRLAERGIKCMWPYHGRVLTRRHRRERMNLVRQRQRCARHHLVYWRVAVLPSGDRSTFPGLPMSERTLFRRLRTWSIALVVGVPLYGAVYDITAARSSSSSMGT